jgi:hypothetical protein
MAYYERLTIDDRRLDGVRAGVVRQVLRWDRYAGHRVSVKFWSPRLFNGDLYRPGDDASDGWTSAAGEINLVVRSDTTPERLEAIAQHELAHSIELMLARRGVTKLPTPTFGTVKALDEMHVPAGRCTRFAATVGDAHPVLIDIAYLQELRALMRTSAATATAPAQKARANTGTPAAVAACGDPDCGCYDLHDAAVRSWFHRQLAQTGRYQGQVCTTPRATGVCAAAAAKGWAWSR